MGGCADAVAVWSWDVIKFCIRKGVVLRVVLGAKHVVVNVLNTNDLHLVGKDICSESVETGDDQPVCTRDSSLCVLAF